MKLHDETPVDLYEAADKRTEREKLIYEGWRGHEPEKPAEFVSLRDLQRIREKLRVYAKKSGSKRVDRVRKLRDEFRALRPRIEATNNPEIMAVYEADLADLGHGGKAVVDDYTTRWTPGLQEKYDGIKQLLDAVKGMDSGSLRSLSKYTGRDYRDLPVKEVFEGVARSEAPGSTMKMFGRAMSALGLDDPTTTQGFFLKRLDEASEGLHEATVGSLGATLIDRKFPTEKAGK